MRTQLQPRLVVALFVAEVLVSCTLLLVASTRSALPIWGGLLDSVLAFAVVGTAAWIWAIAPKTRDPRALSVGHAAAAFIPALVLAAVWYFRESLDLNVLLPGLAWRTFIVLYSVPAALGAWRPRATL